MDRCMGRYFSSSVSQLRRIRGDAARKLMSECLVFLFPFFFPFFMGMVSCLVSFRFIRFVRFVFVLCEEVRSPQVASRDACITSLATMCVSECVWMCVDSCVLACVFVCCVLSEIANHFALCSFLAVSAVRLLLNTYHSRCVFFCVQSVAIHEQKACFGCHCLFSDQVHEKERVGDTCTTSFGCLTLLFFFSWAALCSLLRFCVCWCKVVMVVLID